MAETTATTETTETSTETTEKVAGKETQTAETETTETEVNEEDEKEQVEALRLYKALQNPTSAKQLIKILAAEAGMDLSGQQTKEEKKEIKKGIQQYFEEHLGEEYKFLAPRLTPAIEAIFADRDKQTEARFQELKQLEVSRETNVAISEMTKEFADFKLHERKIVDLMGQIAPSEKLTQKAYLTKLLILAREEAKTSTTSDKKGKKLDKATNDAASRLNTASVGGKDSVNDSPRPINRREAIRQAMEEIAASD